MSSRVRIVPALRRLFILGWLGVFPVFAAPAQSVRELTAEESVRLGLEHSAPLRAAEASADEARAAYRQTRANRLPSLSSQATYTRLSENIAGIEFPLPGADTMFTLVPVELNRYYSEVSIEQPLFTGFRLHNLSRSAAHQAEAAAYEAAEERADVAFDIRETYWSLYQALAVREATDAALAQMDEHLEDVRNLYEVGAASMSDVLNAQTRRSEVLLEQVDAEHAVRLARLELNQQLGLPLETVVRPVDAVEMQPLPADIDALQARALEMRPQINALSEQVEALEAQVAATRGNWIPELALAGRYVYARPNQYFFLEPDEFRGSWEATVAFRWDIWNGGERLTETSQAQARLARAEAQLDYAREQINIEVTARSLEVSRATQSAEAADQNVLAAEESFRMVRRQFEEGAALSAEVLDAEAAYRTALSRRAQSRAEVAIARAALLNALGQVW